MLSKTQLFHLGDLTPKTVVEANAINQLLEQIVLEQLINHFTSDELDYITYNRTPVHRLTKPELLDDYFMLDSEVGMRKLSTAIKRAVGDVILYSTINDLPAGRVLNVECCLLNESTVVMSFAGYLRE